MLRFHEVCGSKVFISNDNRTAERLQAKNDFNNGIVFSDRKLDTNVIFQVRIDKKVGLWSGSIEVGVTTLNPSDFTPDTLPQSATELRNETWLMSGKTILHDGESLIENYGFDLEKLEEGSTVGLMRTSQGELVFFVNGTSQGVASQFVPIDIYAIVNLYGKCAAVTLEDVEVSEQSTNTIEHEIQEEIISSSSYSSPENNSDCDKLRFHPNCGPLVKLSSHFRTAERRRPMEEFNNAVVLTHRPLRDDELFQIRIDMLVEKWSGSIEFGLTTHDPTNFEFPATMTILKNGTVIMSGNGILHDGKATNSPYTNFNLDQLKEGDRIGVMKKKTGDIHYFVNGADQGIATSGILQEVWGAINLYGMAAKVTLVDRNEREEHNLRLNVRNNNAQYIAPSANLIGNSEDCLLFHPNCGFHAAVINNGRTAHRPNARDDFNHGVVLTNRMLKANELFEVRLDKMVTKWAGSIEIGVTTHVPTQLDYPCTMTNVRSGTYMMTGNGVMHNGTSIIDEYGQSLDRLKVGDRVGVLRKENGNLHFFVNGEDQGCASKNVPESVYGVIDLYGQAAQATIIMQNSNYENNSSEQNNLEDVYFGENYNCYPVKNLPNNLLHFSGDQGMNGDLRFHNLHGRNARVSNSGLTASRPNSLGEFNAAIVMSSRALRENELFEVVIDRMVDRWSGNIEAGVTTIRPEELVFPNTMTDIDHDTWMLSGSSLMTGGTAITNRYICNLDSLTVGSRVGMMTKNGFLHFYINGEDMGCACEIPQNIFAVIDLYGQCAQVSIAKIGDISMVSSQVVDSMSLPIPNDTNQRFSTCVGKNIQLKNNNLSAVRIRQFSNGLVFGSTLLDTEELFEIRLSEVKNKWAGALSIGVTSLIPLTDFPPMNIPNSISGICAETWYITGSQVRKNNVVIKSNYCINLNRLISGDRIGVKVSSDRSLKFYINDEDMGIAAYNLPKKLFAVIDLYGSTESITISSNMRSITTPNEVIGGIMESTHSNFEEGPSPRDMMAQSFSSTNITFDSKHGRNIELWNNNTSAKRTCSYNQGVLITNMNLPIGKYFEIKIDKLNKKWSSSLMIGIIDISPERFAFPLNSLQLKKNCWIISGDSVFQNGLKIKGNYGPDLNALQEGHLLGISVDIQGDLRLFANGIDQGIAAKHITGNFRVIVDLYGQCEELSISKVQDLTECFSMSKENKSFENLQSEGTLKGFTSKEDLFNNCDYLKASIRFKNSLCLPEPYFLPSEKEVVTCFCEVCRGLREDEFLLRAGDPPVEYSAPFGWVRFPINISFFEPPLGNPTMTSSTSSLSNVLTTWNVGYHGLRVAHVRRVMDRGELFPDYAVGFINCDYSTKEIDGKKEEKSDGALMYFSPTIDYAAIEEFSPRSEFYDPIGDRKVHARVAFQLLVQPGSYKRGPPSFPSLPSAFSSQIDPESVEWATKEQGSIHCTHLLIRIEGL